MGQQEIIWQVDEKGIAIMTLNRPDKLNAVSTNMLNLLPKMLKRVAEDDNIKVLIITGIGTGFCSGADVGDRLQGHAKGTIKYTRTKLEEPVGAWTSCLHQISKPTIAAVNGVAAGVGFSMCLLCDFRIASETAKFTTAFTRRGLMPDGGMTFSLPRVVGLPKALELMLTTDVIDATEAKCIGLVNKVVAPDKLMMEAQVLAERLAKSASIALSFTKRAAYHGLLSDFTEQLVFESWGQRVCQKTEDFQEGVNSFLEKREPKFQGK